MKGLLVRANGNAEIVDSGPFGPGHTELSWLQGLVGGLIEPVSVDEGWVLLANEEGLLMRLPYNRRAVALVLNLLPGVDASSVGFVGDIAFFGEEPGADGTDFSDVPYAVLQTAVEMGLLDPRDVIPA